MHQRLAGYLIFICVLYGCCCSNLSVVDYLLKEPQLNGRVQSIKTITYHFDVEIIGDSLVKGAKKVLGTELKYYDKRGLQQEEQFYDSNGELWQKTVYRHNKKGQLLERNESYGGGNSVRDVYKYDKKGKITESNFYQPKDSLFETTLFKYDSRGNLVEIADAVGLTSDEKNTFEYLEKGRVIKENTYNADGTFESYTIYRFDKRGNQISCESFTPSNKLYFKTTSRYDKMGNTLESSIFSRDRENDSSKDTAGGWEIKFDLAGHWVNHYKLDKRGNWIRLIQISEKDTIFILDRQITYYK